MAELKERLLASRRAFQGRVIALRVDDVELPDGRHSTREIVEHPGAVAVVALDGEGNLLLVRQYRHAAGKELVEIPAGKIDAGEEPMAAAERELAEETGHSARCWDYLGKAFTTPGFTTEVMHFFLARDLRPAEGFQADEDELIEVEKRPWDQVLAELAGFEDGKTLAGIALARAFLSRA